MRLKLLCMIAHDWEINQLVDHKGRLVNYCRECLRCGKVQTLKPSKKYHPTRFEWATVTKHPAQQ